MLSKLAAEVDTETQLEQKNIEIQEVPYYDLFNFLSVDINYCVLREQEQKRCIAAKNTNNNKKAIEDKMKRYFLWDADA